MAEKPPIPRDIEAVLNRCVGEMRERLVGELEGAETEAERLEVLARFSREIGDVRGKVSGRAGIGIGQKWALIGAGLAVFGAGVVTTSLWPRSQAVTPAAVEAPKGGDEGGGAGEPVTVRPPDAPTEISVPGGPRGGATATQREEDAASDAAKRTRFIERASSGEEQDLHVKKFFFPKFIKALKSDDKAAIEKSKGKLQAARVPKELLDAIERANGALTAEQIKQLKDLGVDTKSFAPTTGSSESTPADGKAEAAPEPATPSSELSDTESSKLTLEKAQERFELLERYFQILHRGTPGNADTVKSELISKFKLDTGLLEDMKKTVWDTSVFERLDNIGIDYMDLLSK